MDQSLEYKINVMQAFQEGKAIEAAPSYEDTVGNFFDTADPSWNWHDYYYRVKVV